jgi:hypothetical protein
LIAFINKIIKEVRAEIAKVDKVYSAAEVPRYQEALSAIKKKISDVPGLEKANTEVNALLKIKKPTLQNIQRVKELMDDHFNLYKVTGDVGEGVAKEGLANIRKDLRYFIENEVEKETGADIRMLNNNVQTSQSILRATKARSTRGLTRANLSLSDLGLFTAGSFTGSPLFGAALVFAKKVMQSATFRLRASQILDSLSDAGKAKVISQLNKGIVPKEMSNLESVG